jgi:hypothetical protein
MEIGGVTYNQSAGYFRGYSGQNDIAGATGYPVGKLPGNR